MFRGGYFIVIKTAVSLFAMQMVYFSQQVEARTFSTGIRGPARPGLSANSSLRTVSQSPYEGRQLFVNRIYRKKVLSSMTGAPRTVRRALNTIRRASTAIWLESKASVTGSGSGTAARVLKEAKRRGTMVTFVVYNLPNRDCGAGASVGEICCNPKPDGSCDVNDGSTLCEVGLNDYKTNFIDRIAESAADYCDFVPMAFIIEPDSLPNLVTNLGSPSCGNQATVAGYLQGIEYAVKKIKSSCESASIYVDGAHGGWLGWMDNLQGYTNRIISMDIAPYIRGFALNVANYHELGVLCPEVGYCNGGSNSDHPCCQADPCGLTSQYNPGFTSVNYAAAMRSVMMNMIPGFEPYFIIDTSRNGVGDARKSSCGNWCNIRDAGVGPLPTTATADPSLVDAYLWIKPPGESDGCTEFLPDGSRCVRFAPACASPDSIGSRPGEPRAPEAGDWFDYQVKLLATNKPQ